MGPVRITVNINKKMNGVCRHIDFELCNTHLEKVPQIPMFYDFFFHNAKYRQEKLSIHLSALFEKVPQIFINCMKGCDLGNL